MDFESVAHRVFDLYGRQRYDEALGLVESVRSDHPDQDDQLAFWRACLLGISERPAAALETLERGLERGLWWGPEMLADTDLDSVRDLAGWDGVERRCSEATDRFLAQYRPEPQVHSSRTEETAGTLITLHPFAVDPCAHAERWAGAIPESWTVVAPVGTVPLTATRRAWPCDDAAAAVISQLGELTFPHPMVLAGYSQGGGVAASLAWEGLLHVTGLILMAPSLPSKTWDPRTHRRVPTFVVMGERDRFLPECLELGKRMEEAGVPVLVDQRPELGHQLPNDLSATITAALGWIAAALSPVISAPPTMPATRHPSLEVTPPR